VDTADGPLCLATDVECDLEQPSELELGLDAALKRTEHVDEGRLDRVLSFFAVAKSGKTECEEAPAVLSYKYRVSSAGWAGRLVSLVVTSSQQARE